MKNIIRANCLNLNSEIIFNSFNNLNLNEKKDIFRYVLEYYGGSFSHEFFLINSNFWLEFSKDDWISLIVDKLLHNKHLALESLFTFFLFYTETRDIKFFNTIGISNNIINRYSDKLFLIKPTFNNASRIILSRYKKIGLQPEQINIINSYKLRCL